MQPIANQQALINARRIAYGVYGEGAPVVLLHGTPSSSLIWRNVMPELVAAGYRVYLFDLLGYGESERPWDPEVDTSISAQVAVLEGLLAHWGLERAHVVAHDIGGGIAQRFALFSPQRVITLTLIDTVSFDSYPSARTREQMAAGLDKLIAAPAQEHRAHFRQWLLSAVRHPQAFADSSLETLLDYLCGPVGQASLFQHQVRHYDPVHTLEIADRLGELAALPVQLLWGENDSWQPLDWGRRLARAIPGAQLILLPDCGHFSPQDQPAAIAGHLVRFMADRC